MLLVVALGWLAKSNHLHSYDPLWYGLRPEQVLAPTASFFDVTGLVSPVYYFPKLYELLIAPLSAMRGEKRAPCWVIDVKLRPRRP